MEVKQLITIVAALVTVGVLLWRGAGGFAKIGARLDEHERRLSKGDDRFAAVDAKLDKLIEEVHAIRVDLAGDTRRG